MADRPIIFSAPMVRALLDGRKTQTRRVLKPHPRRTIFFDPRTADLEQFKDPAYAPGDRLYVREGFMPAPMEAAPETPKPTRWNIAYAAGGQAEFDAPADYNPMLYNYERWSPSIHMPRWASRLTLTVTDVRVQRLQEISGEDCIAEGVKCETCAASWSVGRSACNERGCFEVRQNFRNLWNSLHGPNAWDANPWVCALTFAVHRGNIDQMGPP